MFGGADHERSSPRQHGGYRMEALGVPAGNAPAGRTTAIARPQPAHKTNGRRAAIVEPSAAVQVIESLERACAEFQASSRSKDKFLAMLGHELRNPLSAIRNAIVVARLDRSRSERALEIAWRQTEQLDRLVADILDISLVEQGRVALKRRSVLLIEIIERAVETTRSSVEDRGHTLSVSAPVDPVRVDGDPLRLEQIVVNLVRNAAKYTEYGGRIDL